MLEDRISLNPIAYMVLWDSGGTRDHEYGQQKAVQRSGRQNEGEKLSENSGIANLSEHLPEWIQGQSVEPSLCDSG